MEWMDVNGACLRYELAGKAGAPIVVLIHEIGGCIESWDETLPALRREFRTLRYDQRGFGLSEKVSGPSMALDDLVNDIVAMLDALAIHEPVHVAGSALGSGIAAAFAARHPARVARLVVQSLVVGANPATRDHMFARASEVERTGMRAQAKASLDRSYPLHLRSGNNGEAARFERYRARWIGNDPQSFAAINRMLLDMNIEGELGNIKAPTLLIGCRHDVLRAPALVRTYADKIPDVRYVEADSAHFMHAQTPDLFTRLAVPFLLGK